MTCAERACAAGAYGCAPAGNPGWRRSTGARFWRLAAVAALTLFGTARAAIAADELLLKWAQPPIPGQPDNVYFGWNELSVFNSAQIVADDFRCTDPTPIAGVRWWGSFLGWQESALPPIMPIGFHFAIWTDVPAGAIDPFSHPGTVLWTTECFNYTATFVGWDYDPITGEYEACFEFLCENLPVHYIQPAGNNILWISIAAIYQTSEVDNPWGWKTRPRDPTSPAPDDAVVIWNPTAPAPGMPYMAGAPLYWPDENNSFDTCFELLRPFGQPAKWVQRPEPYLPPDAINGWDELSHYGIMQIVADDWVCSSDQPVTDVVWWGSFLGWGHNPPPLLPNRFHLAIWTDVPAGVDQEFSHPGQVIWEHWCDAYEWSWVGWDFDPRDWSVPPEACYRFSCALPASNWFYQPGDGGIYWLSVSAAYDTGEPPYPWGWKTRPRDAISLAPDDAVAIWDPLAPVPGAVCTSAGPLWWPTPEDSWDTCFELYSRVTPPEPGTKWIQDPQPPGGGFDLESDLWLSDGSEPLKWLQGPSPNHPGLHATTPIQLADDWMCYGGLVSDIHWWGNYENEDRGDGLMNFNVTIYRDGGGRPGAVVQTWNVPFANTNETDTGYTNNAGEKIYEYTFVVSPPFPQVMNSVYWLEIQGVPNLGPNPPEWRWQEHDRAFITHLSPAHTFSMVGGWTPIVWPDGTFSEMAFEITSNVPVLDTNAVMADDFISNGRDILHVRWWGSYFDPRYQPGEDYPLHQLDGWLITFHWADDGSVNPNFPPDLIAGDPAPTALGVYFAPHDAVSINGPLGLDCLGHEIYEYRVSLDQCCLLCSMKDPRNNVPPAFTGRFQERRDYRYWLSIQALTGSEWLPPECDRAYTGHLPAYDLYTNGMFWGWHTGREPNMPVSLNQAAFGQIVSFSAYPPDCWDYGNWTNPWWYCDTPPEPVNMAFHLIASDCPEDFSGNRVIDLIDLSRMLIAFGTCIGQSGYDPVVDLNNDGCINLIDLSMLLVVFGSNCPTAP